MTTTKTIKSTKTFAQEWRESIVENLPTIHYVKGNKTRPALAAADLQAGMTVYASGNCVDSIITSVEPSKTGKTVTISDRTCGGRTRTYRKNASTIIELANDTREKYRRLAEMAERVKATAEAETELTTEDEATKVAADAARHPTKSVEATDQQVAADAVKTESKSVKAEVEETAEETTKPTLAASIAAIILALAAIAERIADITLTGSPKQVAWASDIRSGWLTLIAQTLRSALDDAIAGHDLPQVEYAVHASIQCVASIAGCTSARSIIDARYASDVYDLQFKPLGCDSTVEQELVAAGKAATDADVDAVLGQPKSEADQLADALVAAGGNRWTKGTLDRIYVDAETLGLEYGCYKSGNVRWATWQGEGISNADARRLLGSKVYVDLTTGDLHVSTSFDARCHDTQELEEAAQAWLDAALATAEETTDTTDEADETEADETTDKTTDETETAKTEDIAESIEIVFADGTIRTTTEADVQAIGHTMAEAYDLAVSMMASAASIRVTWLRGDEVVAETRADHEPSDGTNEGSDATNATNATYYSAEQIAALEAVGFRRWQKFGHDRLYYDGQCFDGGIYALYSDATAKAWVDLKTGDLRARTTPRSIEGHVLDRVGGIMHDALLALEADTDTTDSSDGDDADEGTQIIDADHVDHRHVGVIERDGWRYPVTHDETGYHVDLGSDEDALAGITAMLDAEDEDAAEDGMGATPRPPPMLSPLSSFHRRKEQP